MTDNYLNNNNNTATTSSGLLGATSVAPPNIQPPSTQQQQQQQIPQQQYYLPQQQQYAQQIPQQQQYYSQEYATTTDPYYQAQQFNNQYYYNNNIATGSGANATTIPYQLQQNMLPLQYGGYAPIQQQPQQQQQYYYDSNNVPSSNSSNSNINGIAGYPTNAAGTTTAATTTTTTSTDDQSYPPQQQYIQHPPTQTSPQLPQLAQLQRRSHIPLPIQHTNLPTQQPPVPSYRTVPHTNYGVITTMWEDENTLCYQVEANGVNVVRRADNNFINGTKLLNVTKMTRGRRDGILKAEKVRHVVKIGSMHLKGVWIPFDRAQLMAQRENILDSLYPLFVPDIEGLLSGN